MGLDEFEQRRTLCQYAVEFFLDGEEARVLVQEINKITHDDGQSNIMETTLRRFDSIHDKMIEQLEEGQIQPFTGRINLINEICRDADQHGPGMQAAICTFLFAVGGPMFLVLLCGVIVFCTVMDGNINTNFYKIQTTFPQAMCLNLNTTAVNGFCVAPRYIGDGSDTKPCCVDTNDPLFKTGPWDLSTTSGAELELFGCAKMSTCNNDISCTMDLSFVKVVGQNDVSGTFIVSDAADFRQRRSRSQISKSPAMGSQAPCFVSNFPKDQRCSPKQCAS